MPLEAIDPNAIAANFLAYSARRLELSQAEIAKCLPRLTEEQIWHRNGEHENSIANLLLHLEGNIRQWILHGIDNQPDVRRRDDEFTLTPSTHSSAAIARFNATVAEAARIIAALDPGRLLDVIDPQPTGTWRHPNILKAVYKVVGHLEHHTGQIILLTKQLAATDLDLSMPRKR
jgi:uncharacterized damage-inducible protein DinB